MTSRTLFSTLVALAALVVAASVGVSAAQGSPLPAAPTAGPALALERIAAGLNQPLGLAAPDDGSGRLFVIQKTGQVRIIDTAAGDELLPEPFLDLSGEIFDRGEQGLLGLAFHPDFAANGRLFIHYSAQEGGNPSERVGVSTLAEYTVSAGDPNRVDPASRRILLEVPQRVMQGSNERFFTNHKGGQLAFGPDGSLYMALGDGGSSGDPGETGQDRSTLLGTIVRLDVDSADLIPDDNPFVGDPDARDEIWAWGLRNPWRFSFDRANGDLWIADVGQNFQEEVNRQPAASSGGENYGWDVLEGTTCFNERNAGSPLESCDDAGTTAPVLAYPHSLGWGQSVTGGYVYRGSAIPDLQGWYLFGDFVSGRVFIARESDGAWAYGEPLAEFFDTTNLRLSIPSFGEDADGELYLVHFGGHVYRIVPGG